MSGFRLGNPLWNESANFFDGFGLIRMGVGIGNRFFQRSQERRIVVIVREARIDTEFHDSQFLSRESVHRVKDLPRRAHAQRLQNKPLRSKTAISYRKVKGRVKLRHAAYRFVISQVRFGISNLRFGYCIRTFGR